MLKCRSCSKLKLVASILPFLLLACSDTSEPISSGLSAALRTGRPPMLRNGYYYTDGDGRGCGHGAQALAVFDSRAILLPQCQWEDSREISWIDLEFNPGDRELLSIKGHRGLFEWADWSKPGEEVKQTQVLMVCRFESPEGLRNSSSEFTRVQATVRLHRDSVGKHLELTLAHERREVSSGRVVYHQTLGQEATRSGSKDQEVSFWTENYGKVLRMAIQQDGTWKGSLVWALRGTDAAGLIFKNGTCRSSS